MWQLLSVRDGLVKDVNWTAPDMEVLKLGVGPVCLREEVVGTQSGRFIGHLIVKEGSMLDSEGPEVSVGNFQTSGLRHAASSFLRSTSRSGCSVRQHHCDGVL